MRSANKTFVLGPHPIETAGGQIQREKKILENRFRDLLVKGSLNLKKKTGKEKGVETNAQQLMAIGGRFNLTA